MTPLTGDPNVTILIDGQGNIVASATNVAPDLRIKVVKTLSEFDEEAKGKSFVTDTRFASL